MRYIEEFDGDYGQRDVYIMKGGGPETYEPRFTWHAFRKVEISGKMDPVVLDDVEAKMVCTALDTTGYFRCSDSLFNKINENYIRTQLGNYHGSFSSDCPHRERLGYTGDGQVIAQSSMFSFDMRQVYRKWLNDINDARNKKTGFVPHTAPFGGGGGGPGLGFCVRHCSLAILSVLWRYDDIKRTLYGHETVGGLSGHQNRWR